MYKSYSMELAGRTLTVDIGRVAAQANGAVFIKYVIQQSFQQLQHLTSHVTVWISSHSALSSRRRCTL